MAKAKVKPKKITSAPVYELQDQLIISKVLESGVKIFPSTLDKGKYFFIRVEFDNGDYQDGKKMFLCEFKKVNGTKKIVHDPAMWHELKRVYLIVYEQIIKEKFKTKNNFK